MVPTTVSWPPCVEGDSRTFTLSSTVTLNGVTGVALGAAGLPVGLGSGEGSGDRWKNAGVPVASGLLSSSRKSPLSLQATPARAKALSIRSSTARARAISSPPSADASGGYRRREQESLGQHLARQDEGHGDGEQRLESQRQEEEERHLPQRLFGQAWRNQVPVAQDHPHRHGAEHQGANGEAA